MTGKLPAVPEMEAAQTTIGHDPAPFSPAPAKYEEDELKLIGYAVRMLPACAVKDLLSIGVCVRCILRLFNAEERIYSCNSLSEQLLLSVLDKAVDLNNDVVDNGFGSHEDLSNKQSFQESAMEGEFCRICLGILQFAYCDDKGTLAKMDSAKDFAVMIATVVKQDCHEIESFSQEVSLPSVIIEREQAVCLYLKKYESEHWFQGTFISGCKSTKDVLKLSLTDHLETLLGAKSKMSSFHIRLTYTQPDTSIKVQNHVKKDLNNKKRKTGGYEGLEFVHGSDHDLGYLDSSNTGDDELNDGHAVLNFHLEKVNKPCHLTLSCYRTPIYVGGRYLKYSRNVSQTRWIIDDERMGEASVEEIIGSNILSMCKADNYKFHAAGREDIDVRMLGTGRPFLVEIQNARQIPSEVFTKEIEGKINSLDNKLVGVKNLKLLSAQGWALMREGEAEKQKEYAALVWISRSLEDDDVKTISSLKDMRILQKTPIRVLHRRSPLHREKIIHWMKIERIYGSSQYFLLHLCTQAGTYIKEFVHGDLGRTHPSLGSILGCRAEILQLDVTDVKMDCFSAK